MYAQLLSRRLSSQPQCDDDKVLVPCSLSAVAKFETTPLHEPRYDLKIHAASYSQEGRSFAQSTWPRRALVQNHDSTTNIVWRPCVGVGKIRRDSDSPCTL